MTESDVKHIIDENGKMISSSMSDEVYHSLTGIISSSQLKYLAQNSARHYHEKYIAQTIVPEKSDALDFGTLIHSAFLEGKFDQFVVSPKFDMRRTADKAAKQALIDQNPGKILIDEEKFKDAQSILQELEQYRDKYNLDQADAEVSLFWRDGLYYRAKLDAYCRNTKTLFELKTARSVNPRFFSTEFFNRGYDISAAHYVEGIKQVLDQDVERIVMIAVEKERPFVSCEFEVTGEILEIGLRKLARLKDDLAFHYETNTWPGFVGQLFIPKYEQLHGEQDEPTTENEVNAK